MMRKKTVRIQRAMQTENVGGEKESESVANGFRALLFTLASIVFWLKLISQRTPSHFVHVCLSECMM